MSNWRKVIIFSLKGFGLHVITLAVPGQTVSLHLSLLQELQALVWKLLLRGQQQIIHHIQEFPLYIVNS